MAKADLSPLSHKSSCISGVIFSHQVSVFVIGPETNSSTQMGFGISETKFKTLRFVALLCTLYA